MLFLNKFLPLLFLPVGVSALLVVFALWRKKRWPVLVALALLYACSMPLTGDRLAGWLESRHPAVAVAQAGPADAIVVLGGILGPAAAPGLVPNFTDTVERFEGGVELAQAGRAPWLVFTGARTPVRHGVRVEGEELRALAIRRGVPAEKILVTDYVANTADEARVVAGLMQQRGWKKIILVTSAWHMPRAAWLFRRAGVDAEAFPVDFRCDTQRPLVWNDLLPKIDALANTENMLRECYGYAFYRIFR
jgi:uncharacterized SAM-binding protein YcdF (DUF218 family)